MTSLLFSIPFLYASSWTLPNPQVRNSPESVKIQEQSNSASEAYKMWQAGGDVAEAIGTLRAIYERSPRYGTSCALDLARILQSEGRSVEAAEWYWKACHSPRDGGVTRNSLSFSSMVRVVDALEDVGRTEDAVWAIREAKVSSRRELYMRQFQTRSTHPLWVRKWSLKLLKDDPEDAQVIKHLNIALKSIEFMNANPQKFPFTRDVPR